MAPFVQFLKQSSQNGENACWTERQSTSHVLGLERRVDQAKIGNVATGVLELRYNFDSKTCSEAKSNDVDYTISLDMQNVFNHYPSCFWYAGEY